MISAPGVGSGLDVQAIVSQLMALERRPLNALQARKDDYSAQLSAYGKLKSAIGAFQSAMDGLNATSDFKLYTATSSNEDVFTATAGSSASKGSYDVLVNRLAEAHKMGSASFADSDTTTVGNDGDQVEITVNGEAFTVGIGGKTLEEIRDAINSHADNVGVTAGVVAEDDSNHYLTLTADESGTDYTISLSFTDSGGGAIADPLTMATTKAAQDAEVVIDGTYTITRSSNTVSDAIQGVTLNLHQADADNTYTLNVERDVEGVTEAAQSFADAYNNLRKTIEDLRKGALAAEGALLGIEARLRNVLNTPPEGIDSSYAYLAEVGITVDKNGTMSLDEETLETALQTDFNGVAALFADDDQGYAYRLEQAADELLDIDGLIDSREDGINASIDLVDTRMESLERRLESIEERYRAQFAALDSLLAQMQATSAFLSQQLSGLDL